VGLRRLVQQTPQPLNGELVEEFPFPEAFPVRVWEPLPHCEGQTRQAVKSVPGADSSKI